jgi:hypothetical protein
MNDLGAAHDGAGEGDGAVLDLEEVVDESLVLPEVMLYMCVWRPLREREKESESEREREEERGTERKREEESERAPPRPPSSPDSQAQNSPCPAGGGLFIGSRQTEKEGETH